MNELRTILKAEAHRLERENAPQMEADPWRMKFHLMPPTGWMNDPNGLCQFHGTYHVFFQYTPYDARGGLKVWGHYSSRDLIRWEYHGVCLTPDSPYDVSGVYSGSALTDGDAMVLYYTGNVKYDGDYDYVESGREGNTIMVTSPDGFQMGDKICVLRPQDYPHDYTCHIRDPKVWKRTDSITWYWEGEKKEIRERFFCIPPRMDESGNWNGNFLPRKILAICGSVLTFFVWTASGSPRFLPREWGGRKRHFKTFIIPDM